MTSVRRNFIVLMSLQISTYVVPLLTLPWLTRILSPGGYGQLSFALAFTMYFVTFSNYGFYLTATPQIAIHRHDRTQRSKIFWATFLAQALIMVTGFVVLLTLTLIFKRLADDRELLVIGYGMVFGAILLPTWYFQGVEDLRVISGLVFIGRALSVPAMFLLVRGKGDIYWAMGVNATVPTLSGIGVFIYLFARREIEFIRVPLSDIFAVIRDGWRVFMATAVADFYASSNTVVLALLSGNVAAGYFAAGDKLIRAALGMLSPLKTAAYPHISYLMHHAREDAFAFLRKMLVVQGVIVFTMSLTIFGPQFLPTVDVLRWMAFVPFMAGLTDVLGVQTMLPLGLKVQFSRVLLASGVLNFTVLILLAKLFGAPGAAATVLITETMIVLAMAYTLSLQGVGLLKRQVA